jgi:hypothetical protein
MKAIIFISAFVTTLHFAQAQSIVGTWQLIKQTTCLEEDMEPVSDEINQLLEDRSGMASPSPKVIVFKENNTGQESIRLIDHRKASGTSNFLYKFSGNGLYILDKKSQTIKDAYAVERLTADSLIFSNSSRPCEVRIFLRTK